MGGGSEEEGRGGGRGFVGVLEYVCLFVCEVFVHVVGVGVEFLSFGRLKREGGRVMTGWPGQHGCWGCRLNVERCSWEGRVWFLFVHASNRVPVLTVSLPPSFCCGLLCLPFAASVLFVLFCR